MDAAKHVCFVDVMKAPQQILISSSDWVSSRLVKMSDDYQGKVKHRTYFIILSYIRYTANFTG